MADNLEVIGVVLTIIATLGAGFIFIFKQYKKKVEKDNRFKNLEINFTQLKDEFEKANIFNDLEIKLTQLKDKVEKVETSHDKINIDKYKQLAEIKVLDQKLDKVENEVKTSHDKINTEKDKLLVEIKELDQKIDLAQKEVYLAVKKEVDSMLKEKFEILNQDLEDIKEEITDPK